MGTSRDAHNADSVGHCSATLHDEVDGVTHWCYKEKGHNWVHECHECDIKWA